MPRLGLQQKERDACDGLQYKCAGIHVIMILFPGSSPYTPEAHPSEANRFRRARSSILQALNAGLGRPSTAMMPYPP